MGLLRDIHKAAFEAIEEIKREPSAQSGVYCGYAAEVLGRKLVALGHDPRDLWIPPSSAIHIWLAIGNYVVDIWEPGDLIPDPDELRLKYWHYKDPAFRRTRKGIYNWPGVKSGVRPSDVAKTFLPWEIDLYYEHWYEPKKLPPYLR